MSLKDWQILKKGKWSDFMIISAITMIFLLITVINVRLMFEMTENQAEESGQSQLEKIRAEFQGRLQEAETATIALAMETPPFVHSGRMQAGGCRDTTVLHVFIPTIPRQTTRYPPFFHPRCRSRRSRWYASGRVRQRTGLSRCLARRCSDSSSIPC